MESVDAALLARLPLPEPDPESDKNSRGTVLIAGASAISVGAVLLSGLAAFRAGAGKVLLAVPRSLAIPVAVAFPEAGVHGFSGSLDAGPEPDAASREIGVLADGANAVLVGPGFCHADTARELTHKLLATVRGPAVIVDALSLTGLWHQQQLTRQQSRLAITPHAGEMAKLTGASEEDIRSRPVHFASEAARRLGCVVVLKGATTLIAQPDGPAYEHRSSNAALATSGSGDVLAGIIAGLAARGADLVTASVWAVYLHACAGRVLAERMGPGILARELPAEIASLLRRHAGSG